MPVATDAFLGMIAVCDGHEVERLFAGQSQLPICQESSGTHLHRMEKV